LEEVIHVHEEISYSYRNVTTLKQNIETLEIANVISNRENSLDERKGDHLESVHVKTGQSKLI
jgi:hypothetical protein